MPQRIPNYTGRLFLGQSDWHSHWPEPENPCSEGDSTRQAAQEPVLSPDIALFRSFLTIFARGLLLSGKAVFGIQIIGLIDFTTCYIILVVFVATLVRSSLGFGESLLAVPLLALYIPVQIAVPLSVLVSVTVAAWIVIQDGKKIHFRSAVGLVAFALAGLPLGLLLLSSEHESLVKAGLAILILLFSAYALWGKPFRASAKSPLWLGICGIASGILGGAYGLNGPPLVIYGSMRRWSPQHFRATLQGYFLPASLCGMAGYWIKGLWVPEVTTHFLWCLPGVVVAIWAGRVINSRLKGHGFFTYVYGALMIISIILLVQAVRP